MTQTKTATKKPKSTPHVHAPLVEQFLTSGELSCGESIVSDHLISHPRDDQARFGLGVLQFLQAVEQLGQNFYRYGLRSESTRGFSGPFIRLPIPINPNPQTISYEKLRIMIDDFRVGLLKAEATLAPVNDPHVKLPLHFNIIKLDLNGDGISDENESLWKVYASVTGNTAMNEQAANHFLICFDRGDVHWLRGYCHLLSAVTEIYLAHDSHETFEHTAHLLFSKVESPYGFLNCSTRSHNFRNSDASIFDLIAVIHSINWSVIEPKRMEEALHHFEAVVSQSHESWRWIMAETDDDHEWLPNPNQTGVIPNVKVTQGMVDAWGEIMTEIGKLLAGNLLIPFWRGDAHVGINVRKVFLEPRTLDLVYWVQGAAAAPYLQKGTCTDPKLWSRLGEVFGHNFPGFALWFN
ncbi:hypothetical protein BH10CYA1_BH10CYA1_14260 [soil metagenome]